MRNDRVTEYTNMRKLIDATGQPLFYTFFKPLFYVFFKIFILMD